MISSDEATAIEGTCTLAHQIMYFEMDIIYVDTPRLNPKI
jgi:hypothetical protein